MVTLKEAKHEAWREEFIEPEQFLEMITELNPFFKRHEIVCIEPDEMSIVKNTKFWLVRYQRVCALLKAYDLLWKLDTMSPINSFAKGEFFEDYATFYPLMEKKIWDKINSIDGTNFFPKRINEERRGRFWRNIFSRLFELKVNVSLLRQRWEINFHELSVVIDVMDRISHTHLAPMDKVLNEVILLLMHENNPYFKQYTIGELIDKYDYPEITDKELEKLGVKN